MKYDIINRYSGAVIFSAEIDAAADAPKSELKRLAVLAALKAGADLRDADLSGADLSGADLSYANLHGADLSGVQLWGTTGNNRHVRSLQCGTYAVTYTADRMQIGCQNHAITDWWCFDDRRILEMDGRAALEWWRVWKPILQMIIAASPAEPT